MSHRGCTETRPDSAAGERPSSAFLTERNQHAIGQLEDAFVRRRPLALLLGDGAAAATFVIRRFIANRDADTTVVHIEEACADATSFMQAVVASVGFKSQGMTLEDLEGVFSMFLSFQKSHGRRTVICIERAQTHDAWVLDKTGELVEHERDGDYGLLVVVSGQGGFSDLHSPAAGRIGYRSAFSVPRHSTDSRVGPRRAG